MTWDELTFWQSGEWQVIQERLDEYDKRGSLYCPGRQFLFAGLDATPFGETKVCIIGQDPYPTRDHAIGVAFGVPQTAKTLPPSLVNIIAELRSDLTDLRANPRRDLSGWTQQGVLLWNVYPTCLVNRPASLRWDEWTYLTKEIVEKLDAKGIVFCLLGNVAKSFSRYVNNSSIVQTSHPSPLGVNKGFKGSRIFSTINSLLKDEGYSTIDWRL